MPRLSFIALVLALLAAAVLAQPASAHGARGVAPIGQGENASVSRGAMSAEAIKLDTESTRLAVPPASVWFAADGAGSGGHCALPGGSCCAEHCYVGVALAAPAPETTRAVERARSAWPPARAPADAPQQAQLRPPSL